MRLTTPGVPYSLLPEMIAEEKQTEENNWGPIQNSAVRTADEPKVLTATWAGRREPVDVAPAATVRPGPTASRARRVLSSRGRGVRASPVLGGAAGLGPQPLGDLEGDADLEAVAGQRERE